MTDAQVVVAVILWISAFLSGVVIGRSPIKVLYVLEAIWATVSVILGAFLIILAMAWMLFNKLYPIPVRENE